MLNNIMNITMEIITGLFSGNSNEELEQNETYKYWLDLSYQEQEEYFSNNEYLKDYMKNDYYSTDRHLTAKHVQQIANKLNREFTNINNRY